MTTCAFDQATSSPEHTPAPTASAPRRPSHDPLAATPAWDQLPAGTLVSFLLGAASTAPHGRRVVTGEVVGLAVRSPTQLDVQVTAITTWRYGAPQEIDVLPPAFNMIVSVSRVGTVAETIIRLRESSAGGRSIMAATEVPFESCWTCGHTVQPAAVFCGQCARRLRVALPVSATPVEGAHSCRACATRSVMPGGRFCERCGFDATIPDRLAALAGREVPLQLTAGRRRTARLWVELVEVTVSAAAGGRPGAQALAIVRPLRWADAWRTAALPTVSIPVVLHAEQGRLDLIVATLDRGRALRGAEIARPCPSCVARRGADTPPLVRTPYCRGCGARVRLFAASGEAPRTSRERPAVRHACQTSNIPGVHACCGGCGERIAAPVAPKDAGRFAALD